MLFDVMYFIKVLAFDVRCIFVLHWNLFDKYDKKIYPALFNPDNSC